MLSDSQVNDLINYVKSIRNQNEAIYLTLSDIIYKIKSLQESNIEEEKDVF